MTCPRFSRHTLHLAGGPNASPSEDRLPEVHSLAETVTYMLRNARFQQDVLPEPDFSARNSCRFAPEASPFSFFADSARAQTDHWGRQAHTLIL